MLFNPAANSALPAVVEHDELVAANSGIWTAAVLSQIALAPVAGLLFLTAGSGPAFGINAASFLLSAVILTRLRLPAAAVASTTQPRPLTDAAAGVRLINADRPLRALAAGQLLAATLAGDRAELYLSPDDGDTWTRI